MGSKPRLMGYRRENGTMGIRNHVIILPLDDLSNAAAEAFSAASPAADSNAVSPTWQPS